MQEEITLRPKKLKSSLYKLHLKENINATDFENFKQNLEKLKIETINGEEAGQTEEYFKNLLKNFLEKTYYENINFLNTMSYKGQNEADLVIHSNKDQNSKVGVIFELKKPKNKAEMITYNNIFKKAFFESILYFLWEAVDKQNLEVKNIVISNIYEYFIFDARDIKRIFLDKSKTLETTFKKWRNNQLTDDKTDTMYKEIENFVNAHLKFFDNLKFTYFDIRAIEEEDYKHLYKILSPKHLLREVLTNDSNSLNKDFYNELLHIIGLEEVEKEGKKVIQRKSKSDPASLLENAINIIDSKDKLDNVSNLNSFGANNKEKIYNVSLSLCIRWINRILFLKLLEGQLYKYHGFDKSYKFLDSDKINSFDKLNNLFFSVLAKKTEDRKTNIQNDYFRIPYLNSSLFELSSLENEAIDISQLENNLEMEVYKSSVLKDNRGKKLKDGIPNLKYLLDFLNSFDFGSEGENKLNNEIKPLINASVLGLIFEKINGYKDGSFYTPSFITTYMCRESIQKAVMQKFNDKYTWTCESIDDLYNKIDRIDVKEANDLVNSLKICDPAVGSGHFLVSALNEIIALKSELGIFCDAQGKKLKDYKIENFNDELVITDEDDNIFEYHVTEHTDLQPVTRKIPKEKTRVQKALFFEKKNLIENCLFGVDINNNSVMICRLRLWIELLKNAFYTDESYYIELETLPNIDINIKQGNSLISRYDLDVNLSQVFNKEGFKVKDYRDTVRNYKETNNKDEKRKVLKYLEEIKNKFKTEVAIGFLGKIRNVELEINQMSSNLFGVDKETKKKITEKQKKLDEMLVQKEEIEKNEIYQDAFEWRFEFPEVLDNEGDFIGFDVVIGNPPYGVKLDKTVIELFKSIYELKTSETAILFIERGYRILKNYGIQSYIIPKSYTFASNYSQAREFTKKELSFIVDCGKAFDQVKLEVCIFSIKKFSFKNYYNSYKSLDNEKFELLAEINKKLIDIFGFFPNGLTQKEIFLGNKIFKIGQFLKDIALNSRGDIIQKYVGDKGDLKVIGGKEIDRYGIRDIKGFVNKNDLMGAKYKIKDNSILAQNIIAHIIKPYERIKIIACLPNENNFAITDTINQITINDFSYSEKFIWVILFSKLINWYVYLFIFGKAIRTMHFDNVVTDRIPIPKISLEEQKQFIELVDQILEKKKENLDTTDLERKIDEMVYQLYELTPEEIAIIEGEK